MSATQRSDFPAIVRVLDDRDVTFMIVGGVAAVLQGAPVTTFDLDVLHARSEDNVSRLLKALDLLDARYRFRPEENKRPQRSHLMSPGHQLLATRHGPLDLLGSIGESYSYQDLIGEADEIEVGAGVNGCPWGISWGRAF